MNALKEIWQEYKSKIIGFIFFCIVCVISYFVLRQYIPEEYILLIFVGGGALLALAFYGNGLNYETRVGADYQMKLLREEWDRREKDSNKNNSALDAEVLRDIFKRIEDLEDAVIKNKSESKINKVERDNESVMSNGVNVDKLQFVLKCMCDNIRQQKDVSMISYNLNSLSENIDRLDEIYRYYFLKSK